MTPSEVAAQLARYRYYMREFRIALDHDDHIAAVACVNLAMHVLTGALLRSNGQDMNDFIDRMFYLPLEV